MQRPTPVAAIFFLCSQFAFAGEKYQVIPETESRDHRYAVAEDTSKEKNYVVDLKTKKIIGNLSSTYSSENRHDNFEATWSSDNAMLIISYTHRYGDCGTFEAVSLTRGKAGTALDLQKLADESFDRFLRKSYGTAYDPTKESIVFGYDSISAETDSEWTARAVAVVPGDKSGTSFYAEATIRFRLTKETASRSNLKFELVNIQQPKSSESPANTSPSPGEQE
jgi:hypothetical protein